MLTCSIPVNCSLEAAANFRDDIGHAFDAGNDLIQGIARFVDQGGTVFYSLHRVLDERLDFFGCTGRALCQVADLSRDNGKASPLLSGSRRFHGCVQGQQVGLESDFIDGGDDVRDLLG